MVIKVLFCLEESLENNFEDKTEGEKTEEGKIEGREDK
jgi:hypothetical protein